MAYPSIVAYVPVQESKEYFRVRGLPVFGQDFFERFNLPPSDDPGKTQRILTACYHQDFETNSQRVSKR